MPCTAYIARCSSEVSGTVCHICIWPAELGSELLTGFLNPSDLGNGGEKKKKNLISIFQITDMCLGRLKILTDVYVKRLKMLI